MHDISRILDALVDVLSQRHAMMDEKVARSRDNEIQAEASVKANQKDWASIGILGDLTGARDRVFNKLALALTEFYIHKTRTLAWQYAKRLLEALAAELTLLSSEVTKVASMITEATEEFKKNVEIRCTDGGRSDVTKQVARFSDPQEIRG